MTDAPPYQIFDPSFSLVRVAAINAYAHLEERLCHLMRALIGCDPDTGRVLFYNIVNTRARYAIIAQLIKNNKERDYSRSWRKIEKWLGTLDGQRNKAVHWVEQTAYVEPDWASLTPEQIKTTMPTSMTVLWNNKQMFNGRATDASLTLNELNELHHNSMKLSSCVLLLFRCVYLAHLDGGFVSLRGKFLQPRDCQTPTEFLQFLIEEP